MKTKPNCVAFRINDVPTALQIALANPLSDQYQDLSITKIEGDVNIVMSTYDATCVFEDICKQTAEWLSDFENDGVEYLFINSGVVE